MNEHEKVRVIQDETAAFFELSREQLLCDSHEQHISIPRQIAMRLCREQTSLSFPRLASAFHRLDHTTIIHGFKRMGKLELHGDPRVALALATLRVRTKRIIETMTGDAYEAA